MVEFQWKVWKQILFYTKCLWISYFFQIFTFVGSSVICLSLSEIPIWTHQREFGLKVPNSEIFNLLNSRDFYTIKPPWVDDFGTVIKNQLFSVWSWFKSFIQNSFSLRMLSIHNFFLGGGVGAKSKIKIAHGCFWIYLLVNQNMFYKSLLFGYFYSL